MALFSVSKATMRPQSGPRWTPPGRVNTHPEVASGNGESFLLFLEEILSFQVTLGIRDLAMPLNPWSWFPHLDHVASLHSTPPAWFLIFSVLRS